MNTNLHVGFISPLLYNYLGFGDTFEAGGAERQQYLIAKGLLDRGYEVSILTRNWNRGGNYKIADGFKVWKTLPNVRGTVMVPYKTAKLMKSMHDINADIYYSRANTLFAILGPAYARISDSRFVYAIARDSKVDPNHLSTWNPIIKRAFIMGLQQADAVVTQTQHQARLLNKEHGVNSTTIPNGYKIEPKSAVSDITNREYVLWVGRMDSHQKKPERFLTLATELPNKQFVMIGPPNEGEKDYYERIQKRAEAINNLDFIGPVNPEMLGEFYNNAIVLVNTSDYEGLPNTFIEAWQYAVPVISLNYDFSGKLEKFEIGNHSGSMSQLIIDVRRLCENVQERERLGWNGREYVEQHHSFETFIDRYERVFLSL